MQRTAQTLAEVILDELRDAGRPVRAEAMAAEYGSANLVHLGCTVGDLRGIAKRHAKHLRTDPGRAVDVVFALVEQSNHDSRLVAYELLALIEVARDELALQQLGALYRGNDNWAVVDSFCSAISGPQYSAGILAPTVVEGWARSADRWVRRQGLATVAIAFQRAALRARSPVQPSIRICGILVDDRTDHVVKALSWALRNVATRDPDAVERFVQTYDARLAARVRREVRHKLATGAKNRRKGQ